MKPASSIDVLAAKVASEILQIFGKSCSSTSHLSVKVDSLKPWLDTKSRSEIDTKLHL